MMKVQEIKTLQFNRVMHSQTEEIDSEVNVNLRKGWRILHITQTRAYAYEQYGLQDWVYTLVREIEIDEGGAS